MDDDFDLSFDFKTDFSSFDFEIPSGTDEPVEIPKLAYEPVLYENAEAFADAIDLNKDYMALVAGTFVFGDFLEALLDRKELAPDRMFITTLGMSQDNVDSLVNLVDYLECQKLNLIISSYFAGVERHHLIPYMEQEFKNRPINIAVLQSHCKMSIIRSAKADIIIIGSANLSSCNNVEQLIIAHDPTMINYMQERLEDIMDRFTVYDGLEAPKFNWRNNKNNTGLKAFKAIKGE